MTYTKILTPLFLISLTACTPRPTNDTLVFQKTLFVVNGDTIQISRDTWNTQKMGNYPFTSDGVLSCALDELLFYPTTLDSNPIVDFEHAKATPVNQKAKDSLDKAKMAYLPLKDHTSPSSDLTIAINLGLAICRHNAI